MQIIIDKTRLFQKKKHDRHDIGAVALIHGGISPPLFFCPFVIIR